MNVPTKRLEVDVYRRFVVHLNDDASVQDDDTLFVPDFVLYVGRL